MISPTSKGGGEMEQYLPYFVWLAAIILAVVVEAATAELVSIWFVAGGIAALIASICGAPFWLQTVLFIAVTAVTLAATRPLVKKLVRFKKTQTNSDRYIGKSGVVKEEINNTAGQGQVEVLGSIWTARSADGSILPAGSSVLIREIQGVKLIVDPQR